MVANHTGLFPGVFHHDLRGMLEGSAEMHVSPVSILQYTLIASSELPWFGSTQYSPEHHRFLNNNACVCIYTKYISTLWKCVFEILVKIKNGTMSSVMFQQSGSTVDLPLFFCG